MYVYTIYITPYMDIHEHINNICLILGASHEINELFACLIGTSLYLIMELSQLSVIEIINLVHSTFVFKLQLTDRTYVNTAKGSNQ